MVWLHVVIAILFLRWIRQARARVRQAEDAASFWMESMLNSDLENAQLRLIIRRYERGEPVPEKEIDAIMGQLRKIGLVR